MTELARPRVWALGVLAAILAGGCAIAAYLVVHHENRVYGDATLTLANCPESETISCDQVNASSWSEMAGVPIAALAIPTYLLVLGLTVAAPRHPQALAYTFSIGVLTVLYSAVLFVVSKTLVGFLCLWCMRLYAVNLSIPILTWIASRRRPGALVLSTLTDLKARPATLRRAALAFVALLALTIAGDRALRAHVRGIAAEQRRRIEQEGGPTLPAVPEPTPTTSQDSSSLLSWVVPDARADDQPPPPPKAAPAPYTFAGPLRRLSFGKDGTSAPFDLQSRIGKGKPVALIFWAPGFSWSERSLVSMASYFSKQLPQYEVYAVSGLRDDQRDEEVREAFALLDVPASVPLLIDDKFTVSSGLAVLDVPNVALFSAKGQLVIAKIKGLDQLLITSEGNRPASDVMALVAKGTEVAQVSRMFPYYPAEELRGRCAPAFQAKLFDGGKSYSFSGRSPSGKPTLVMFWSSTCKHCQVDVPQLVKWVKAHPGAVDIVGVTIIKKDKPGQPSHRAITTAYIKDQGITWTVVEDVDGIVTQTYASTSTPTTYFVSPTGSIEDIWYYAHDEGFDAAMDRSVAKAKAVTTACTSAPAAEGPRLATNVLGPDGKRVELASLLDRGGLVHFWATWCKPCVEELPDLMKFRDSLEKGGGGRLVLISIEGEGDGARIQEFQKKLGLDLHSYRAPKGGIADKVDVAFRLPRTFVVGPGGAVLDERQGSQAWSDPAVADAVRARLASAK